MSYINTLYVHSLFGTFMQQDVDEINIEQAIDLVKSNKSVFVWIGGWTNPPLAELLQVDKGKVIEANPFELMDMEKYPKELQSYERPIFVCHHGQASYELVKELASMNIKGYSLAGGAEAVKTRA